MINYLMLKGRPSNKRPLLFSNPATLYIFVVSNASSSLILGNIVDMRFAIINLPQPGTPIINTLYPPADATTIY